MKIWAILGAGAAVLLAAGAHAMETKTVSVDKLFPFLGNYYALPASERTEFHLAYRLIVQGAKIDQIRLAMQNGAGTVLIAPDQTNHLAPLPTPEALKSHAALTCTRPDGAKLQIQFDMVPNQVPAQSMNAKDLALAVAQASAGAKKAAGLLAMAVPVFDRIEFEGVTAGEVAMADGTAKKLPFTAATVDGNGGRHPAQVHFVPGDWPGAVSVHLDAIPSAVLIAPKS